MTKTQFETYQDLVEEDMERHTGPYSVEIGERTIRAWHRSTPPLGVLQWRSSGLLWLPIESRYVRAEGDEARKQLERVLRIDPFGSLTISDL